jgi:hypothetical protein
MVRCPVLMICRDRQSCRARVTVDLEVPTRLAISSCDGGRGAVSDVSVAPPVCLGRAGWVSRDLPHNIASATQAHKHLTVITSNGYDFNPSRYQDKHMS